MTLSRLYFLCGVGGSGMSALAQLLLAKGHRVRGSDRSYDQGRNADLFADLRSLGVTLCPQDGSGVNGGVDRLVVSSAVEETVADVRVAKAQSIPIQRRAELLAEMFATYAQRIAVGGTSGKSTVTAMVSHILSELGCDATMVNGAAVLGGSTGVGNIRIGQSDTCVIEADESDGTIALYDPTISVLTNIGLDHRPMEDLLPLFQQFVAGPSTGAVMNADCAESHRLLGAAPNVVTFGIENVQADLCATDVVATPGGSRFRLSGHRAELAVPGRHNVANALAAVAAVHLLGHAPEDAVTSLGTFQGIHRRLECIGRARGITVIDDFAHNPDKIRASLDALRQESGRLLCVFQPHGYSPLRLFGDDLVETFVTGLGAADLLIMTDVFYAGGTVTRDVSPQGLVDRIREAGRKVHFMPNRVEVVSRVASQAREGDCIVVMGARDPSLSAFAQDILAAIRNRTEGDTP